MLVRIAVADPLPVFRHGVVEILRDAGFESETPDDLLAWVRDEQTTIVILTLQSEADWRMLEGLRRTAADLVLVALLEQMSVPDSVRALRAGAACVMARDASPSAFRERFRAVVRGESVVPVEVLRELAAPGADITEPNEPSAAERDWLRNLARGTTVGRLAAEAGYSERMMFRLLRDLYTRIGAQGRTDALITAQQHGWL
ncbi:response regulator transcription factor [Actinoplanes flavus]|uniref:Response regulator transcription factor n=1 Tax=Actinoplanes flavus TaxID=2820290 RepID=A0ABS3UVL9_9ACTN|nr:response regulator transcription factor [Actinoplanes flavus]MBO3742628.1 response regulator transcription factor [Actinoplanes flavus]